MTKPAPILISVYNRLHTLEKCIVSLKENELACKSDLFIVSDAAQRPEDESQINKIRAYCKTIVGFKTVNIIENTFNKGSYQTVLESINNLLYEKGKIIFLEDDNVVSSNFLNFINESLDLYEKNEEIFSVTGFTYPISIPSNYKYDIYFWQGFSAWGVGLWYSKWNKFIENIDNLTNIGKNILLINPFKIKRQIGAKPFFSILHNLITQKKVIDTFVIYYMYKEGMYSVYPTKNRVRNIGHDGQGEHCKKTNIFIEQSIYDDEIILESLKVINNEVRNELLRYFHITNIKFYFRIIRIYISNKFL